MRCFLTARTDAGSASFAPPSSGPPPGGCPCYRPPGCRITPIHGSVPRATDRSRPSAPQRRFPDLTDLDRRGRCYLRSRFPTSHPVWKPALTSALNDFAALCPEVEVDVSFSDRMGHVVDDGFDLAVRIGRPDGSSLVIRKLCAAHIVVVCAPACAERHGLPETPADLTRHSCTVDTNFRYPKRWQFTDATRPGHRQLSLPR